MGMHHCCLPWNWTEYLFTVRITDDLSWTFLQPSLKPFSPKKWKAFQLGIDDLKALCRMIWAAKQTVGSALPSILLYFTVPTPHPTSVQQPVLPAQIMKRYCSIRARTDGRKKSYLSSSTFSFSYLTPVFIYCSMQSWEKEWSWSLVYICILTDNYVNVY